jgi:hypothetical protein
MSAAEPDPNETAEYLFDNYGHCRCDARCLCLRGTWKGLACPYWVPLGVRTYDELREWIKDHAYTQASRPAWPGNTERK